MRTTAAAIVTTVLLLAGLQPASAATTPSQVGLVSFINASYSRTTYRATLTIDWPAAHYARSYQVYVSRSYSMSNARRYSTTSSTMRLSNLSRGVNYFVQVRGVNGSATGAKSKRVGHTTIRRQGTNSGPGYRVMTYNVCSNVCDVKHTTSYRWPQREPAALQRIAALTPDVIAAQEANFLTTPPGYVRAAEFSAKALFYRAGRFDIAAPTVPKPATPAKTANGCVPTYEAGRPTGHIYLGYHASGCRYAIWAELVDRTTSDDPAKQRHVLFVDVHTVSGDTVTAASQRGAEMNSLFYRLQTVNPKGLPVVIAGDFNSHKNRSNDSVASVMHRHGYYDAYDLARSLYRQHYNSYNAFSVTPRISYTWGDHVDHVWAIPTTSWVDAWRNGVLIKDNKLVKPIPSDHSPIVVDLRVN